MDTLQMHPHRSPFRLYVLRVGPTYWPVTWDPKHGDQQLSGQVRIGSRIPNPTFVPHTASSAQPSSAQRKAHIRCRPAKRSAWRRRKPRWKPSTSSRLRLCCRRTSRRGNAHTPAFANPSHPLWSVLELLLLVFSYIYSFTSLESSAWAITGRITEGYPILSSPFLLCSE